MPNTGEMRLNTLHIIKVAGEDTPALGSDLDGAIRPWSCQMAQRTLLIERMLQRVGRKQIRKICSKQPGLEGAQTLVRFN